MDARPGPLTVTPQAYDQGVMEKPYEDGPLPEGAVAHVQMARSAHTWLPDVEAYLASRGLTTEVAPTVCDLVDAAESGKFWMIGMSSLSMEQAVDMLDALLRAHPLVDA